MFFPSPVGVRSLSLLRTPTFPSFLSVSKILETRAIKNWTCVASGMLLFTVCKHKCTLTIRCHAHCVTLKSCHDCGVAVHLFTGNKTEKEENHMTSVEWGLRNIYINQYGKYSTQESCDVVAHAKSYASINLRLPIKLSPSHQDFNHQDIT